MSKLFTVLFLFCAVAGWAQQPLLTTHWTQGDPYNRLCPADPLEDYNHCYAGCPAVTMGQIINYLKTTQGTRFDDDDDYSTGNYFGRMFNIDDDWEAYQFPSFEQLNMLLDSADAAFVRGDELTDSMTAALVFACGVACKQVYSASSSYGSGTFYVDQAFAAYQRFGFSECQMFREPDSAMYATLIANLQAGYPAHLAVESADGRSGHNVVVDGYRESDGKFHINFGWGGSRDNWYPIPDSNGFSYGWTKIEGIIVNIIPTTPAVGIADMPQTPRSKISIYPNPTTDVIHLKGLTCETVDYAIFNAMGQKVAEGSSEGIVPVAQLGKGIYLLRIKADKHMETARFVVR
ncbi:MAG: C10 family peptidase [Bacteroidales bacterium]|nr:C10 family peptidase [Bacteroidales bacterium]